MGMTFRKTVLTAAALVFLAPLGASATIVGSRHDLSASMGSAYPHASAGDIYTNYGQVCVYCHTPHDANPQNTGILWNKPLSTATYTLYSSPSAKLTPGQPAPGQSSSALCLSCHDGTIAVDTVVNPPNTSYVEATTHRRMSRDATGDTCGDCHSPTSPGKVRAVRAAFLGTDLTGQHPINMLYDNTVNTGLAPTSEVTAAGLKLYGGKVECASCHDPHLTTNGAFLRKTNGASALCLTCHTK